MKGSKRHRQLLICQLFKVDILNKIHKLHLIFPLIGLQFDQFYPLSNIHTDADRSKYAIMLGENEILLASRPPAQKFLKR